MGQWDTYQFNPILSGIHHLNIGLLLFITNLTLNTRDENITPLN